jgi:peptidoglycan/LPS O-acetylase OafA/YrhL
MNKHFSLYLDLVRFCAAVLVVIAHFCQHDVVSDAAKHWLPQLGREAVVIFFVLSGFVIAYTSGVKSVSLRQYMVARCARIYSVALPILLASIVAVALATLVFGKHVSDSYQLDKLYIYVPMHLLFTGELWNLSQTPPWLVPYWSLGYEVWYYVLFGALTYSSGKVRLALVTIILLIMGHKLWLLLPVWMSGVYLYRHQKDLNISANLARFGWLMTLLALILYKAGGVDELLRAWGNAIWPFAGLQLGSADRYLADYTVCAMIYLNFLFARQAGFATLQLASIPIRSVAAYTFTLYLIHAPVMAAWQAFYPHDRTLWTDVAGLSLSIGLACYLFSFVTERRKAWFQHRFDLLFTLVARVLALLGRNRQSATA